MRVPFGEWLPDLPAHENVGALEAKNVIPELTSYRSMRGLTPFTDALTGDCLGSFWARSTLGNLFNFAGDANDLYELSLGTTWSVVSKSASPYNAADWDFTQFGNRVIATNVANAPQYFDMETSSTFLDLPGSPPNAKHVAVVRDFVVLGDIDDGVRQTRTLKWSGFNNSENWTISQVTQSDEQELRGRGGEIRRIVPGDVGTIFQERSISRMTYVGPPVVFRIDEIERGRGATGKNSVVWTGTQAYFHSTDGFYRLDLLGNSEAVPIGANRVDRWFAANAASDMIIDMRAAIDRVNSLVLWAFKSSSLSSINDRLLIYNWRADRWAHAQIRIQTLAEFAEAGLTLDQLDTPLPAGIDIDSISVDSTAFAGNALNILAFNSENKAGTFDGSSLNACIDTTEFSGDGHMTFINSVRPLIDGTTDEISVQPITRDKLLDNPVARNSRRTNTIGEANARVAARYHRYRITTSGDFSHASGIEAQPKPSGRR